MLILLALLTACAPFGELSDGLPAQPEIGQITPDVAAKYFFRDLAEALRDPNLADRETRIRWAERLTGYFAPNERDIQQEVIGRALTDLVIGLKADQKLSLELLPDDPNAPNTKVVFDDGQRAIVQLQDDVRLRLVVSQVTDQGESPVIEEEIGIGELLGNPYNAVPVINMGGDWFLTEGWPNWEDRLVTLEPIQPTQEPSP
jgi:hypothetical protein